MKPALSESTVEREALDPGDRVECLGDFGLPTGEFGTVERSNDEDALVKWDDDGRMRFPQPRLKKS
jgi:transcription elongation factor